MIQSMQHAQALAVDATLERELVGSVLLSSGETIDPAAKAALHLVRPTDIEDATLSALWKTTQECVSLHGRIDVVWIRQESGIGVTVIADLLGMVGPGSLGLVPTLARRVALGAIEREERDAAGRLAGGVGSAQTLARRDLADLATRRGEIEGAATERAVHVWDAADVADMPDEPVDEFIDRVLVRPGIAIAYGPPSSGKSYAILAACHDAVMGGGSFCGVEMLQIRPRATKFGDDPDRVLWIFGSEDTPRRMRKRLRQIHEHGPHREKAVPRGAFAYGKLPPGIMLNTPRGMRWLRAEIEARGASIVVLDTVASVCGDTLDVNDNAAVGSFMLRMHALRDELGLLVWLLHHTRKSGTDPRASSASKADAALGAGQWRAQTDTMLYLEAIDGQTQEVRLAVVKAKDIDVTPPPLRLTQEPQSARFRELIDDEVAPQRVAAPRSAAGGRPPSVTLDSVLDLRAAHPDGVPWVRAYEILECPERTWRRVREPIREELLALGHVVIDGTLRWAAPNRNAPPPEEDGEAF